MIGTTYIVFLFIGIIISISSFVADRYLDRLMATTLRMIALIFVVIAGISYNI